MPASRRSALLTCCSVAVTALLCGGLITAAVLAPAPPVVLPLLVAVCIGLPILAALDLAAALGVLRAAPGLRRRHLARLRRDLARLPETAHPLDL